MIDTTLARLEARIRSADTSPEDRAALMALVAELRGEVDALEDDLEGAEAVHAAGRAVATGEPPGRIEERLVELETSHPRVAAVLRSLMQTLADAGI